MADKSLLLATFRTDIVEHHQATQSVRNVANNNTSLYGVMSLNQYPIIDITEGDNNNIVLT